MATWLISALNLLRSGRFLAGAAAGTIPAAIGIAESIVSPGPTTFGFGGGGGGGGVVRRRRRRRALTQSDKNDIAFMAATLGDTAARKFALIIAARVA